MPIDNDTIKMKGLTRLTTNQGMIKGIITGIGLRNLLCVISLSQPQISKLATQANEKPQLYLQLVAMWVDSYSTEHE